MDPSVKTCTLVKKHLQEVATFSNFIFIPKHQSVIRVDESKAHSIGVGNFTCHHSSTPRSVLFHESLNKPRNTKGSEISLGQIRNKTKTRIKLRQMLWF